MCCTYKQQPSWFSTRTVVLVVVSVVLCASFAFANTSRCCDKREVLSDGWQVTSPWRIYPSVGSGGWSSYDNQGPINTAALHNNVRRIGRISSDELENSGAEEEGRGKFKVGKKYKKFLVPLLLAYKLKFFTLIPVLIGGLILLTGATGLAGFFFALFAAVMGLKGGGGH